ncbi:MAG: FecR domain-containing protein [Candidatus Hydrogenedentes bacterium]|nr:FecR domain-containing protein [Candidatus Hydrogenedentota bacterium]
MSPKFSHFIRVATLALAVLATATFPASADNLLHARISHESGGALVRGSDDADWSYATINTIILPGDTLWIDQEGTLEVEMSGGSFLRMADRSKAELQSLPPSTAINAWTGSFYVQRVSRSNGDVRMRTPAATIVVDRDTQVRVDIVGEGSTTVSVRWGRATVATDGGAPVEVTNGQRVFVDPGLLPSNPVPFDKTAEDSFDAWNRERARLLALGDSALPTSVRVEESATPIGYSDLASYGEWVYIDNRQYWRPTIVQEYVPYRDGYWSYGPSYGYSWTGYYPFDYVTAHYGRWNYYPAYGWCWGYDPVWSPAWCATAYYGGNFVWCPLDYYNRPCSYGTTFVVGGVPFSIGFSSYCYSNDLLYYGPCSVYPAHSNIFVNVNVNDIYCWNIYSNKYPHNYSGWGSNALYRDYNPRRVIRGIESGGGFTVAASQRARALNSELGRTEFSSRSSSARSVRTSLASTGRQASVRNARLNTDATALDTGATIRRAQSRMESLRGSDDSKPQVAEARRARTASLERSANEAQNSKLPGATSRMSSARSVRGDNGMDTIRAQGDRVDRGRDRGLTSTLDAAIRDRGQSGARIGGGDNNAKPGISDPGAPRERPIGRIKEQEERRNDGDGPRISTDSNARIRSNGASGQVGDTPRIQSDTNARGRSAGTSRTLDDTRVRMNENSQAMTRTQVPREPNLPRISGGDGRNERSQSLGTIPQVPNRSRGISAPVQTYRPEPSSVAPRSRIIADNSRVDRGRADAYLQQQQSQAPQMQQESPRARYDASQVQVPQRFEPQQQQRFEAPQQRFEAPQQRSIPQVQVPQRFEAPRQRFEAPPAPRIEAPRSVERSFSAPSISRGDGGGSRLESRGGGDGGGRSRGR